MSLGLDADQLGVLAAAVDRLAPADETGPGGVELGVVEYVAATPAEDGATDAWAEGLAALDARARARRGSGFVALDPAARDAVLTELEESGAPFFELLRDHVLQGMFGDPAYGGNRDGGGWALLSYPGPKLVWSEREQRLDALPEPAPAGSGGA